jgi:hypothetical protein
MVWVKCFVFTVHSSGRLSDYSENLNITERMQRKSALLVSEDGTGQHGWGRVDSRGLRAIPLHCLEELEEFDRVSGFSLIEIGGRLSQAAHRERFTRFTFRVFQHDLSIEHWRLCRRGRGQANVCRGMRDCAVWADNLTPSSTFQENTPCTLNCRTFRQRWSMSQLGTKRNSPYLRRCK